MDIEKSKLPSTGEQIAEGPDFSVISGCSVTHRTGSLHGRLDRVLSPEHIRSGEPLETVLDSSHEQDG